MVVGDKKMSELEKIFLTSSLTITGGLIMFCATTLLQKLLLDPVLGLKKALAEVSYVMQYHAWVFHADDSSAPKERFEKVFEELRSYTARMRVEANSIIFYDLFAKFGFIPKYPDLIEAAGRLIRISNSLGGQKWEQMSSDTKAVQSLLRIDIGKPRFKREH